MTLGGRIAQFRKAKGLSQEALADAVGVSRQAVSKWELGEAQPDAAKIVLLARALDMTTDQLLLGEEAPSEKEPPKGKTAPEDAPSSPPPTRPDYPAALGRFVRKHGYKAGYLLIVYGLVLLLFAGGAFALFHGFFSAADQSLREFNGYQNNILYGQGRGDVQFELSPGVSLSPDEIAAIEEALAQEHHPEPGYTYTYPHTEVHAFPVALQRGVYAVLSIPAVIGLALVVTGVVVIVKFKRDEV